jgi:hydroxyacylglutathione hydrolase
MVEVKVVVVGMINTNCYILSDSSTHEAIVIDPGGEPRKIISAIEAEKLRPKILLATHAHFDHVLGVDELRSRYGVEFKIHLDDLSLLNEMQQRTYNFLGIRVPPPPAVDNFLEDREEIKLGETRIKVVHTPGHSPGSVSFFAEDLLLSGDALFKGSIGRTDGPGGDSDKLVDSIISKIFSLPDEVVVYPGHGPKTTVAQEKEGNPFVGRKGLARTGQKDSIN